ncbi:MAG: AAA family ATPase [Phycisphaerae bacterium]|nr:AAA family ATPase [Phycisphaerae bacterium]NUQ45257.1 AAA family ATPase [Phycisphaerae bacterium]
MSKAKPDRGQIIRRWLERDLTREAADGELPRAFEIDEHVAHVADMLASGRCPVLIGESGCGKTAVIHEFSRQLHGGALDAQLAGLRSRRVLQFSLERRAAELKKPSDQMGPEFKLLSDALAAAGGDVIPFFRDIHLVAGFGLEAALLSLMTRLRGSLIAEGLSPRVEMMFEESPELESCCALLRVEEPSPRHMERILSAWAAEQAERRGKTFTDDALGEALDLSVRFLTRGCCPRKTLDLLSQAAGFVREDKPVDKSDIVERFRRYYRVPRAVIDSDAALDLSRIEADFSSKVLGQSEAVRAVVRVVGRIKSGLADSRRPFGVFLFAGPTGVGKTHLAQLLTEFLFGDRQRMVRINMADFDDEWRGSTLFGEPDGTPAQQRGLLTQRLLGRPFAVLLLDEFEKAHANIHGRFMQLFDEGCFINAAGETISCRSMIIIATSNAGADIYRGEAFGFVNPADAAARNAALDERLQRHFRVELLNRFDQIVYFHPLSREDIRTIALRELEQIERRAGFRRRGFRLEIDESVLDWLAVNGYDAEYGARFLRRTIERHVTTALSELIVRRHPPDGAALSLSVRGNQIVARLPEPPASPAPPTIPRASVALPTERGTQARAMHIDDMRAEAQAIIQAAKTRLDALAQKETERDALLARMNEADFWNRSTERSAVLERFRALEVAVRAERRLAQPIVNLAVQSAPAATPAADVARFARVLERAAQALRAWEQRDAEEGDAAIWVVLGNVDPLRSAGRWIGELTAMERAWAESVNLSAALVACEVVEGDLSRAVLDVVGPGASHYFEMEVGVHRRVRRDGPPLRVRIDVLPRSSAPPAAIWPGLRRLRSDAQWLQLRPDCRARLELPERGLAIDFVGRGADTLSHLLHDLSHAWRRPAIDDLDVCRVYGEDGVAARDPRTGAKVLRMKSVLQGRLDPFLNGWRRRG